MNDPLLIDQYEKIRTGAVRTIAAQVDLLTDALHALRNGSPEVTEEFIDRSLTALRQELIRLKQVPSTEENEQ